MQHTIQSLKKYPLIFLLVQKDIIQMVSVIIASTQLGMQIMTMRSGNVNYQNAYVKAEQNLEAIVGCGEVINCVCL